MGSPRLTGSPMRLNHRPIFKFEAPTIFGIFISERFASFTSSPSSRVRQAGGSPALAATFLALLIDFDSGTGWVIDHREASAHALWAVALRWFDHEFFHQPITPFISTSIAFTSDNRCGFSRGPRKFLERVYPS